jgi:hypothetical protein
MPKAIGEGASRSGSTFLPWIPELHARRSLMGWVIPKWGDVSPTYADTPVRLFRPHPTPPPSRDTLTPREGPKGGEGDRKGVRARPRPRGSERGVRRRWAAIIGESQDFRHHPDQGAFWPEGGELGGEF